MTRLIQKLIVVFAIIVALPCVSYSANVDDDPIIIDNKNGNGDNNGNDPRTPDFDNYVWCNYTDTNVTIYFTYDEGDAYVSVTCINGAVVTVSNAPTCAPIQINLPCRPVSIDILTTSGNEYYGSVTQPQQIIPD